MADDQITEEELIDRWGISSTAIERLIEEDRLPVQEEREGQRCFSLEDVEAFEESEGGEDFLTAEEAVEELGIPQEDLEEAVQEGSATEYRFGAEARYTRERLDELEGGREEAEIGAAATDQTQEVNEDDLFDFGEDIGVDLGMEEEEEAEREEEEEEAEGEEEEEKAEGEEEDVSEDDMITGSVDVSGIVAEEEEGEGEEAAEVSESEMITEVVDVSGLEAGEEDLLGDIIEDVGADIEEEPESTGGMAGEETVEMGEGVEATADITELDEETVDASWEEGERTADISQLEEESFEGEELEDILAGEEELHGELEEDEDFEVPYGTPVAAEAEASVPVWIVVVLVLAFVIQAIGALFVVENSVAPEYKTGITESINLFKE
ncbi:MAG: hypothetical protein ACLFWL_04560 [Candidatus Brocadiia bacterium]